MSGAAALAVFGGAGCGALLRWGLGVWLNAVWPMLPLGTLAANLIGGLLVGLASGYFLVHAALPHEWRLLIITGFLGGLTTFSTFSVEVVRLMQQQQYGWAATTACAHLVGSLALTALGLTLAHAWFVEP
jgi:CrcB protein